MSSEENEYQIVLRDSTKLKNLYDWFIQIEDSNGKTHKFSRDLIPYKYSRSFIFKDLKYYSNLERKTDYKNRPKLIYSKKRGFTGKLDPQTIFYYTNYSFIDGGKIEEISIQIEEVEYNDEEEELSRGTFWYEFGGTHEVCDFHEEERNDSLFIYIGLDKDSFESLYNEFKDKNIGELYLTIDGPIDGFYSGWSPEFDTHFISILTDDDRHKIVNKSKNKIEPPTLGKFDKFTITNQNQIIVSKNDEEETNEVSSNIGDLEEEIFEPENDKESEENNKSVINEEMFTSIKDSSNEIIKLLKEIKLYSFPYCNLSEKIELIETEIYYLHESIEKKKVTRNNLFWLGIVTIFIYGIGIIFLMMSLYINLKISNMNDEVTRLYGKCNSYSKLKTKIDFNDSETPDS